MVQASGQDASWMLSSRDVLGMFNWEETQENPRHGGIIMPWDQPG